MNTTAKKMESPIQLWPMLGPLCVVCIMFVMVVRSSSTQWGLPLVALGGILMCYRWKWKGFAGASIVLAAVAVYQIIAIPTSDLWWTCVLTLSILSSFVVTVLFLDESQSVLDVIAGQSATYHDNLSELEEKLAASQNKLEAERQIFTSRIEPLKRELAEREEKIQSHDKLIAIVREELMSAHSRQEKLLQDLYDSQQQSALFEQKVVDLQRKLNETNVQENQMMQQMVFEELNDQLSSLSQEKQLLESTLSNIQGELEVLTIETQEKSQVIDIHEATIQSLKTTLDVREEELQVVKIKSQELQKNNENREKALHQQVEELMKKLSIAMQQLGEWQQKLHDYASLTEKCSELNTHIQEHISDKRRLLHEVEKARHDVECAENHRALSEAAQMQLQHQLEEIGVQLVKANEQISANEHLTTVCQALKDQLNQLQTEKEEKEPEKSSELRRVEGLYNQLRGQFAEKTKVLDETRRTLFHTQEKLAALQKNIKEMEIYGDNDMQEKLYRMLGSLDRILSRQIHEQQNEISQLHELIDSLIFQSSSDNYINA